MGISSTNYTDFSYVAEVTAGITPATPAFQRLPVKSVGLSDSLSTTMSEVIRSDRQTDDLTITDAEIGGDCSYELSYDPYQPLIVSLLQGGALTVFSATAADISVTAATRTFSSAAIVDFAAGGMVAGARIRFAGFTNAENNGIFLVESVTTTSVVVTDTGLVDEVAGASITTDSKFVRNGAQAMDTFTFRKQINAPTGTNAIFYYRGVAINTMSFDFASGAILSGTMGLMGRTAEGTPTAIVGETITDVAAYNIMNSVSSVTSIDITGLPATTAFSSFNLSVDNQINAAKAVGVLGAADLAPFSLQVTADIEVYFEDLTVYNIYKNATGFSVAFTLEDAATNPNIMVMDLPNCKFSELSEPVDGKDAFLMETGSLTALRDATNNFTIQFSFFDAV